MTEAVSLLAKVERLEQENRELRARLADYEGRPTIPAPPLDWDDSPLALDRGSDVE